ncbi:MAG TPA: hypothetical protein VGV37_24040 [Aliidongia sp.]|uniref:hypothetical protein n=1 Tax=Aliidongia sp. TaxID=1914230 RepID=UPI002DDC8FB7|nr:hypothetical protein [Aliidongia sp.]HEV2677623.1 hypothetical protein [Aliidongia sp.]
MSLAYRANGALARAAAWGRRIVGRPPAAARIYLHIGRNKVGSTTLQDFFRDHRAALAAGGVRYALFGHMKDSVPGIVGFGHQDELAAFARAHPDAAILVSNEFMFGWPREYTESMVAGLKGLDVRVIAYIRPYDAWTCSSYAQDVRNGESLRDFDSYFDWVRPRISAWPYLEAWGEGLGWDRVRVRSIDGRGAGWAGLVPDCLAAMGLDPRLGKSAPASNQAPHWSTIELLRALIVRNLEEPWSEAGWAIAQPLRQVFEDCLTARPAFDPKVQYLTPAQAKELAALYNRDIEAIGRRTGFTFIPQDTGTVPDRPFLPAFGRIPPEIRQAFADRVSAPDFIRRYPEAAAAARSRGLLSFDG